MNGSGRSAGNKDVTVESIKAQQSDVTDQININIGMTKGITQEISIGEIEHNLKHDSWPSAEHGSSVTVPGAVKGNIYIYVCMNEITTLNNI